MRIIEEDKLYEWHYDSVKKIDTAVEILKHYTIEYLKTTLGIIISNLKDQIVHINRKLETDKSFSCNHKDKLINYISKCNGMIDFLNRKLDEYYVFGINYSLTVWFIISNDRDYPRDCIDNIISIWYSDALHSKQLAIEDFELESRNLQIDDTSTNLTRHLSSIREAKQEVRYCKWLKKMSKYLGNSAYSKN